ncbi:MAG: TonB-dependent receptor [bacterium]|nr:TonB-dependent receptor [bacterium]
MNIIKAKGLSRLSVFGLLLICTFALGANAAGLDNSAQSISDSLYVLPGVVVTATRGAVSKFDVPQAVDQITREQMADRVWPESFVRLLETVPGVMVQKTGRGQGSPYIRGLTGFRTLLLIDGIRLNNSVFRDGPNQYAATIDYLGLSSVEVTRGPASVLYGTDAAGGTVQAIASGPIAPRAGSSWYSRVFYRFASAEQSHITRLETSSDLTRKFNLTLGLSGKNFGDIRAGGSTGIQERTGYDEIDYDGKLSLKLSDRSGITFGLQSVSQEDVWRTHKTIYGISWEGTEIGSDSLYLYDQRRLLGYLKYSRVHPEGMHPEGSLKETNVAVSYHVQEEDNERTRSSGKKYVQGFEVSTVGIQSQFTFASPLGEIRTGVDFYHDGVQSYKRSSSGSSAPYVEEIQGPVADDAAYITGDIYLQCKSQVADRVVLYSALRESNSWVDVDKFYDVNSGAVQKLERRWRKLAGSARLALSIGSSRTTKLYGGVSQGFRVPNLSDLTRMDAARSNEVEVPVRNLDPEEFISFELGIKRESDRIGFEVAAFYSKLDEIIVRVPTGTQLDGEWVVTKKNSSDGYITGLEVSAHADVTDFLLVSTAVTITEGKLDSYGALNIPVREPLDRLAPASGLVEFLLGSSKSDWRGFAKLEFSDRQDKLSSRDATDIQRIPPGGTPGYAVVSTGLSLVVNRGTRLSLAVENLFDHDYRVHGSGYNEVGRNLVLSIDLRP